VLLHLVKVTILSKSTKFSSFSTRFFGANPTVLAVLAGSASRYESQRPYWDAYCPDHLVFKNLHLFCVMLVVILNILYSSIRW
jgi:hypothetical protein